jgi:hypothetical protein
VPLAASIDRLEEMGPEPFGQDVEDCLPVPRGSECETVATAMAAAHALKGEAKRSNGAGWRALRLNREPNTELSQPFLGDFRPRCIGHGRHRESLLQKVLPLDISSIGTWQCHGDSARFLFDLSLFH